MARRFRAVQTVLGYSVGEVFDVDDSEELDHLEAYLAGGKVAELDRPTDAELASDGTAQTALVGVPAPPEPVDPGGPAGGDPAPSQAKTKSPRRAPRKT
jgi:hypothetical protein